MPACRSEIAAALAAALLAGCGPSVERAYSNCVETAHKQTMAGGKTGLPPELARTFEKVSRAQAEKQCSVIRDECHKPQSPLCQSLVGQYGK